MVTYKEAIGRQIQQKMAKGLTLEEAYKEVLRHVTGLYKTVLAIGEERGIRSALQFEPELQELRGYVTNEEYGFRDDGNYYFTVSDLRMSLRVDLERREIIKEAGVASHLNGIGVSIPEHFLYKRYAERITFYTVPAETLGIA